MTVKSSGKEESLPHSSIKHQTKQSLQLHSVVINFNYNHLKMTPVEPSVTTSGDIHHIATGATQIVNQTITNQTMNNNYSDKEKNNKVRDMKIKCI